MRPILVLLSCLILPGTGFPQDSADGRAVLESMLSAVKNTRTLKFRLKDHERIKGAMVEGEESVKMNLNPLKFYFHVFKPDRDAELLWVQGDNQGNAWVHPNRFPWITVKLDPYGPYLKTGHHTLFEIRPGYFADMISSTRSKLGDDFFNHVTCEGNADFDGRACYRVVIDYPSFGYVGYTVAKDEDLGRIAEKFHLSEYMILEKNPGIKSGRDVKTGQRITLPNNYARETVLLIEKKNRLPVMEAMYDETGLFEKYEYFDMESNPPLGRIDFSRDNPEYHF